MINVAVASTRNNICFCIFYFSFNSNHFLLVRRVFLVNIFRCSALVLFVLLFIEFFTNKEHIISRGAVTVTEL